MADEANQQTGSAEGSFVCSTGRIGELLPIIGSSRRSGRQKGWGAFPENASGLPRRS